MTEVVAVRTPQPAVLDVVFLHGLDGDPRATWCRKDGSAFWPQWLGEDFDDVAVWSVGYDAWSSKRRSRALPTRDEAVNLLAHLQDNGIGRRPLCFVTHSLGGLLAKEILLHAAEERTEYARFFAVAARGVVFLSTPHTDSSITKLFEALGPVCRDTSAVDDLQRNAAHLRHLNDRYRNWAAQAGIAHLVFHEGRPTKGLWVVDQISADPGLPQAQPIPIDADHVGICKPHDRQALVYGTVKRFVSRIRQSLEHADRGALAPPAVQQFDTPLGRVPVHPNVAAGDRGDTGEPLPLPQGQGDLPFSNALNAGVVPGNIAQAQMIGSVTFGAVGAGAVSVEDAVLDLDSAMASVLDRDFSGRTWLLDQIDQALSDRRSGYVWIEGPAGVGKSAIASHLVQSRGWPGHFVRLSRGASETVGLRNLAGQLIQQCGLWELTPGRMLPEWAGKADGFERVLRRAAAAGKPLVLVVDGADEADTVGDERQPWGLPSVLPDGVFVVGTYRSGYSPPSSTPTPVVLSINPHDDRNRDDVADYLKKAFQDNDLQVQLLKAGTTADEVAAELTRRCGGIWVYLRYALEEIRLGQRNPRNLNDLLADLSAYYLNTLDRWRRMPRWDSEILPVLSTLAVVGEPLSAVTLAELAGVAESTARSLCYETLRPFLSATDAPIGRQGRRGSAVQRFEILHASFRELLTGDHADTANRDRNWAEVLDAASRHAHDRIATHYLNLFGGLDTGIERLGSHPGLAGGHGGYPLRHLARHLLHADRSSELHDLLRAECTTEYGRVANVWFAAHDTADTIDDYLADIATASADSQRRTDACLSTGRPASSLLEELRYWLITASITSLTTTIPTTLLVNLLRKHLWTPARAVAHARRLPTPDTRSAALTALVPYLPEDHRIVVATQSLAAATAITDESARATALAGLAPHLSPQRLAEALTAVTAITSESARATALAGLAPHLSSQQLAEALTAATAITSGYARAEALTALIPHLPLDQRPAVLTEALAAATDITSGYARVKALTALVPHLPLDQRPAVLTEALATATDITDEYFIAQALGSLAPHLPSQRLADALTAATVINDESGRSRALAGLVPRLPIQHLAEVLAVATALSDEYSRAEALTALAPRLPLDQRTTVLADALTAATAITDESARAEALGRLAPHLPAQQLADALATAIAITDESARAEALGRLAPHLSAQQLADALAAVTVITSEYSWAAALTALAPHLPLDQRTAVLADALTAAAAITSEYSRAKALGGLAPHLPAQQLADALATATAITDDSTRAAALTALAPHLPAQQLADALAAATAITSEYARAAALSALAAHLPVHRLAEALAAATVIRDKYARAEALTALAPHLQLDQRPAVLAEALAAATGITDDSARAAALTALAPHLSAQKLADALAAATAITGEYAWAEAVAGLAPYLPVDQRAAVLVEALVVATAISDEYSRAEALAALAPHLSAQKLAYALTVATAITDAPAQAAALTGMAPHLSAQQLSEALTAATAINDEYSRAEALTALAPHLPVDQRAAVLTDALATATTISSDFFRARAVAGLAPHLSAHQLTHAAANLPYGDHEVRRALLVRANEVCGYGEYVSLLRTVLVRVDRARGLHLLSTYVSSLAGIAGLDFGQHADTALRDVHRWWP
ncbi:AAA family ATPase [Amycolatopsis sp. cmx-4-83]|uniref:AAA family ATPase n=1 Tax=Amycolatopsis sp. cmx-4-83 TaxID=2790940 RepID=UPI003979F8A7